MKILILTQYYPPETGAPQNRLSDLAYRLSAKGNDVEILTAMPNYPKMKIHDGYSGKLYVKEIIDNIIVHRAYIYVKNRKSIFFRLLNYFSFVISSGIIGLVKLGNFDIIISESPPLFLGISAKFLAKWKRSKLIFNVSDLWPESAEKLGLVKNKFLLKQSYALERRIYKKSWFISGQTMGIVNNIKQRFPEKDIYWLKNGINFNYFQSKNIKFDWRDLNGFAKNDFIISYTGIIGFAQGLEVIVKTAGLLKNITEIKFVIVGNGPEKQELIALNSQMQNKNVYFFDVVDRELMPSVINSCNASIIPLKKLDLFKGAIPSKTFESLAMKKPILLGIEGEAYDLFIKEGKCGLAFEPENEKDLSNKVLELYNNAKLYEKLSENAYNYVKTHFDREIIANEFWNFVNSKIK